MDGRQDVEKLKDSLANLERRHHHQEPASAGIGVGCPNAA